MRLDVRYNVDRIQRIAVQHDARFAPLSDPAKLGQCRLRGLRAVLLTMSDPAGRGFRRFLSTGPVAACWGAVVAGVVGPACAQADAGSTRIPTVTRLVKAFNDLEGRLDAAARAHDSEVLD